MGLAEHREKAPKHVACMVITVSDTRTPENDTSGDLIKKLLSDRGHRIEGYLVVRDDSKAVKAAILKGLSKAGVQAIILNGGTGISKRDGTYEVVSGLLEKRLDGFGELFRYLSYQEIGSAAMMSRAIAGVCRGKAVISMPGSTSAVELAMKSLVLHELDHMIGEVSK
ncbi:MAG TPA: MogA/MoaB family molybdenum cofactor biosynthesis protein [Nitrospiria bacterium]|jgi:molybdenum cofactor biosynthesis protein B|nr:MogA/MoaB family molybdenum cofactor biosynthesis protein [Nitrospiria bacterium]